MAVSLAPIWLEHDKFANALPQRFRDSLGCVFTPRPLALRLVHETLSKFPKDECPRVLDPCSGLGSLLLATLEWATVQRPLWVKPLLTSKLQGWEIARELNDGAHRVLGGAAKLLGVVPKFKLITTDSLMNDDRETFEAVVAFPRFKELRGEAAQDMPPDKRAWLARKYGSFASFPTVHGVFAELAGRLVSRSGGRVGILLPTTVADHPDYAGLRRALANLLSLEQVLPQNPLPGLEGDPALFVLTAGKGDISGAAWQARKDENEQVYQSSIMRHGMLPATAFGDVGVNPGNSEHLLFTDKPEAGSQPLREADDVIAFGIRKPRRFLRGRVPKATGHYAKIPPPEVFKQVQIVIKRDGWRPVAARHIPPAFFRDDLIGCFGAEGHDPDYLLGVFNSEYFGRLYRDSFKVGKLRADGKITVEQLRLLPVPTRRAAKEYYDHICVISRELQKVAGNNPKLLATLDVAVQRAYRGK